MNNGSHGSHGDGCYYVMRVMNFTNCEKCVCVAEGYFRIGTSMNKEVKCVNKNLNYCFSFYYVFS